MLSKLTVGKAGRIVLPKLVRDELHLAPGDVLELDSSNERIVLRPLRAAGTLRKKRGVWVYHTGEPLSAETVNETLEKVRQERDEQNFGKNR
jgi:AbrB family looped-hinge helix DNA binding protein